MAVTTLKTKSSTKPIKKLVSFIFFSLILSFLSMLDSAYAKTDSPETAKTVEGIGIAAGKTKAAHDEALNRALRNAVERAIGVLVQSESLVKNFQLVEDHIYSQVQGYVEHYEIIEDNKGENDLTRIKIRAEVKKSKLETDLQGIKIVLQGHGNPKTMVILKETLDHKPAPFASVTHEVESYFSSKTFPLVDASQIETIKERDAENSENDPDKAKVLGKKFGAELVISGQGNATLGSQTEAYGVQVYAYSGTVLLKAIHTDTGEILASFKETGIGRGGTPIQAAEQALGNAWEKGQGAFLKTILEKWRSSLLNHFEMSLIISKCSPSRRASLMQAFRSLQGIHDVTEKTYDNGICQWLLQVDGALVKTLDESILEHIPELQLTSKSSHRLDFELAPLNSPEK